MRSIRKKVMGTMALVMLLIFSAVGCGTEQLQVPGEAKVENSNNEMEKEEEKSQESEKKEEKEEIEVQEKEKEKTEEKAEEDGYLDVESAKDKEVDYSKYEEKKSNGSADKKNSEGTDTDGDGSENSGSSSEDLVTYSDGTSTEKDQYQTDPIPEGNPNPVEPGSVEIDKSKPGTCYLSIACDTILNHMGDLTEGKDVLVPEDGIIFSEQEVTFYQGESVYDVLLRETQNNRIHMEASFTPMYNSAYVEGINNLYEFDCGQYSGWMYEVNGWYPNYGCSRYLVKEGDVIHWNYTCDLGRDLGQIWEG